MVFQARYGKYLLEVSSVSQSYEIHYVHSGLNVAWGLIKCVSLTYIDQDWKSTRFARSIRILYVLFEARNSLAFQLWVQHYLSMT